MSALIKLGLNRIAKVEPKDLVIARPSPLQREFRRVEERPRAAAPPRRGFTPYGPPYRENSSNESGVVALPRFCGIHDRKYVAYYRPVARGKYSHTNCGRLTADIVRGGFSGDLITASVEIVGETVEICPWCGCSAPTAFFCSTCRAWICYGRSDGDYYLRCRPSCGAEGKAFRSSTPMWGVISRME